MEPGLLTRTPRGPAGSISRIGPAGRSLLGVAPLLEPVGLGQVEGDVYLDLLVHPRSTPADLSSRLELPITRVRKVLQRLHGCGLAVRLVGSRSAYVAAPPEVAVDALVMRRQQQLEKLRVQMRDLAARVQEVAPPAEPSELIEVVESADAVAHHLARMQLGATEEVLIIDSPPYLYGQPVQNDEEFQALRRGVRYRGLYHAPGLEDADHLAQTLACIEAGEEARALPEIRMKMIIVDRRQALVPLHFASGNTVRARLLVHASPLLDALVMCFEFLWSRATPIGGAPATSTDALAEQDRRILTMMAGGVKDRAIARTLGVTERTIGRRIQELMSQLQATTRFQAGLQAARRGWL